MRYRFTFLSSYPRLNLWSYLMSRGNGSKGILIVFFDWLLNAGQEDKRSFNSIPKENRKEFLKKQETVCILDSCPKDKVMYQESRSRK